MGMSDGPSGSQYQIETRGCSVCGGHVVPEASLPLRGLGANLALLRAPPQPPAPLPACCLSMALCYPHFLLTSPNPR